jgi:hypothetical protein
MSQTLAFEVRAGIAKLVSDGLKFEYFEEQMVSVELVAPSFGSIQGGTRVAVSVCCGKVEGPLQCSFGDDRVVAARIVSGTGCKNESEINPPTKMVRPIQPALARPNLCENQGLLRPARIDARPIAVPWRPAIVSDVP